MGLLQSLKASVSADCQVKGIKRGDCRVKLTNTPQNKIVIDFDRGEFKQIQDTKKCDFLCVFVSGSVEYLVPLELKPKVSSVKQIVEQLQACADFVDSRISSTKSIEFIPMFVYRKRIHPNDLSRLRQASISFGNGSAKIRRMKCNSTLAMSVC